MYNFKEQDAFDFAAFVGAETRQVGDELHFKLCPYCRGGSSGDQDTFAINLGKGVFKCFRASCMKEGHFVELARDFQFPLVDENAIEYRDLPQREIVTKDYAVEYMKSRGISEVVTRAYKLTVRNDQPKTVVFPFYDDAGVLRFIKYRNTKFQKGKTKGSKEYSEKGTMPILFGMDHCIDFTRLVITEGQIDSLSLVEAGIKNAVSVPTGASGFTWLGNCWEWINKFDEIVVFGDYENGHITLIDTLEKKLQKKVKCVRKVDYLFEKDANDILRKHGRDALVKAVENAELREVKFIKRLANVRSVNPHDLEKIKTGIRHIDRIIGGIFLGHVYLFTGKRGEGKSTLVSQITAEAIEQGYSVFAYSGELPADLFKSWLDRQIAGKKHIETITNEYGDPEYYLKDETVRTINRWYYDKMFVFDNTAIADEEYEGLLKIVVEAICRYDVKLITIDNLMTAMDFDPGADLYRAQSSFVKKLERIAQQYNVAIILVAHPKKTDKAFDNDTVSGSSDITNAVSFVLNYERAREGDEHDSNLMVTKNRLTGKKLEGGNAVKLYYGEISKRISENPHEEKEYECFRDAAGNKEESWEEVAL